MTSDDGKRHSIVYCQLSIVNCLFKTLFQWKSKVQNLLSVTQT